MYKEIDETQLPVYMNGETYATLSQISDPYIENILDKFIGVYELTDKYFEGMNLVNICLERVAEGKLICIVPEIETRSFIKPHIMKIANVYFGCYNLAFELEYGSPYIEKLQEIVDRILEVGIYQHFRNIDKLRDMLFIAMSYEMEKKSTDKFFILILVFGYSISTIAFGVELLMKHSKDIGGKMNILHKYCSIKINVKQ